MKNQEKILNAIDDCATRLSRVIALTKDQGDINRQLEGIKTSLVDIYVEICDF